MKKPNRMKREADVAFNLRLSPDLVKKLDAVAEGGPSVLSRNQLIQRVLRWFADEFDALERNLESGEPAGWSLPYDIAGYFEEKRGDDGTV
jgi:hypothetical protein